LKPVGKTLENMRTHLEYDKDLQTFMKDQDIEDAYQTLKPILDNIHEDFITQSLESAKAKSIDFSGYLEKYRQKDKKDKKEISDADEKKLRDEFAQTFKEAAKKIKNEYQNIDPKTGLGVEEYDEIDEDNHKKKGLFKKENHEILTESAILRYIEINIDKLTDSEEEKKKIKEALDKFKRFFTYFGGFNQNRENYYFTKDEKATAVATRIVHENLPKFCDNVLQFSYIIKKRKDKETDKTIEERVERKQEYLNAYNFLKSQNKTTQIKDAESGKMIEASAILEYIFIISYFSSCLSQSGKDGTREYSGDGKHKFFTYLKKGLGFTVRKKELKRISVVGENGESIIEKGNMDVEITVDALDNIKKYDTAILFSGDADFLALVNYIKNSGKKVYIFSSKNNISHELKTGGDGYFDLRDIKGLWGKDLKYREK